MGLIDQWVSQNNRSEKAARVRRRLKLQGDLLFNQFVAFNRYPEFGNLEFVARVERWLNQFSGDDDRWAAFRSLDYFTMVGELETHAMYRCAVDRIIVPWISTLTGISPFVEHTDALSNAIRHTWFLPLTDSFRINEFVHHTECRGVDPSPDCRSLMILGNAQRVRDLVAEHAVRRIIVLDDFVGSASQTEREIRFMSETCKVPLLICPLMVCAPGNAIFNRIASELTDVTYSPVFVFSENCLVGLDRNEGEPALFEEVRALLRTDPGQLGGAFGYRDVGSLIASYLNCPDNTPPIFHKRSESWPFPLFPRLPR